MKRVVIVAAAASAASALIAFAPARPRVQEPRAAAPSSSRPNVLLILAEGAAAGERRVRTPNLDRLAQRGRRFDAAYTTYPLAAAARTSLMTGWRPEKTGVWSALDGRVEGATPLQEHFRANGYFIARVGSIFQGPGEGAYRWDAVSDTRTGVPVATRAAAVVAQAREPFFVAASLGAPPPAPASAVRATTGEAAGELPAIAAGPLDPLARPHGISRPRRLPDSERQALGAGGGRTPPRARRAGGHRARRAGAALSRGKGRSSSWPATPPLPPAPTVRSAAQTCSSRRPCACPS
jgi:hypothetical protein